MPVPRISLGLGLGLFNNRSAGLYHGDILAWETAVIAQGGTLTSAEKLAATRMRQTMGDVVWGKLRLMCIYAVSNSTAKRVPLKMTWGAIQIPTGSPGETNEGYVFDGTVGKYIRTGLIPSSGGVSTLNSFWHCHQGGLAVGDNAANRPFGGSWTASGTQRTGGRWRTTNVCELTNGLAAEISLVPSIGATGPFSGSFGVSCRAANDGTAYRNGAVLLTDTSFTTDSPPTTEEWVGAINGGGAENFKGTIHTWARGLGLTDTEMGLLDTAISRYLQDVGQQPNIVGSGDSLMADGSGATLSTGATDTARWYQKSTIVNAVGGTNLSVIGTNYSAEIAAYPHRQWWNRFWSAGRNNIVADTDTSIISGVLTLLARPGHLNYRWIEIPSKVDGTENAGSALAIKRIAVNSGVAASIGQRVIWWKSHLQSKATIGNLTDVQDLDNDLLPRTLSDGVVHPNATGQGYLREAMWNSIKLGWANVSQIVACYGTPLAYIGAKAGTVAAVADTLKAIPGGWDGNPTWTYQWKRAGVDISGATGATYVAQAADVANTITCNITGTGAFGSPVSTLTTALTVA